jgi:hypothetical protein
MGTLVVRATAHVTLGSARARPAVEGGEFAVSVLKHMQLLALDDDQLDATFEQSDATVGGARTRYGIVIPCHPPYRPKLEQLLASMEEYVLDAESLHIFVIVSAGEEPAFESVRELKPRGSELSIVALDSLLGIGLSEIKRVTPKWLALNTQAVKKFVALWLLPFRTALLLDADSTFIRPVCLATQLEAGRRFVHFDSKVHKANPIQSRALAIATELLRQPMSASIWAGMVVFDQWIIDKRAFVRMVREMVLPLGTPSSAPAAFIRIRLVEWLVSARSAPAPRPRIAPAPHGGAPRARR